MIGFAPAEDAASGLALLGRAGFAARVIAAAAAGAALSGETPRAFALRRAEEKAWRGARLEPGRAILAAERVVARGRRILPAAARREEAERCLRLLSGGAHRVYVALCLIADERVRRRIAMSRVVFKRLGEAELAAYLEGGEWRGRKGGYDLAGRAGSFIRLVSGAPGTLEGLPLHAAANLLAGLKHTG